MFVDFIQKMEIKIVQLEQRPMTRQKKLGKNLGIPHGFSEKMLAIPLNIGYPKAISYT